MSGCHLTWFVFLSTEAMFHFYTSSSTKLKVESLTFYAFNAIFVLLFSFQCVVLRVILKNSNQYHVWETQTGNALVTFFIPINFDFFIFYHYCHLTVNHGSVFCLSWNSISFPSLAFFHNCRSDVPLN